jgi:NAD(P)-dependent dehydrogenase (short-subunit alcohol dehydrogenase family)
MAHEGPLDHRVIAVTGAASGIGGATAQLAAERGHAVIAVDRDEHAMATLADALRAQGAPDAIAIAADVTDEDAVERALDEAVAAVGVPTGAVCCAGVDGGGVTHEFSTASFDRLVDVNLRGTFLTCRGVIARLVDSGETGAIVCVSSISAFVGVPGGTAAYSASKGGVTGLVRSLAVEYAPRGIRINAIAPGATETPLMWANVEEGEMDSMRETVCAEIPLGRLAMPREQAAAALWALSDEAAYMTGSHLVLDGGVLARASLSV